MKNKIKKNDIVPIEVQNAINNLSNILDSLRQCKIIFDKNQYGHVYSDFIKSLKDSI